LKFLHGVVDDEEGVGFRVSTTVPHGRDESGVKVGRCGRGGHEIALRTDVDVTFHGIGPFEFIDIASGVIRQKTDPSAVLREPVCDEECNSWQFVRVIRDAGGRIGSVRFEDPGGDVVECEEVDATAVQAFQTSSQIRGVPGVRQEDGDRVALWVERRWRQGWVPFALHQGPFEEHVEPGSRVSKVHVTVYVVLRGHAAGRVDFSHGEEVFGDGLGVFAPEKEDFAEEDGGPGVLWCDVFGGSEELFGGFAVACIERAVGQAEVGWHVLWEVTDGSVIFSSSGDKIL